jgi:hypothetical protein
MPTLYSVFRTGRLVKQRIKETEQTNKTNSVAFSSQANYTDRPTDRNFLAKFSDKFAYRVVSSSQGGGSTTVVNLSFLGRSRYFSLK